MSKPPEFPIDVEEELYGRIVQDCTNDYPQIFDKITLDELEEFKKLSPQLQEKIICQILRG